MVTERWELSDGVITLRPPAAGDGEILIAGRDAEWERWLAPGSEHPEPTACIIVADTIVGWVDADASLDWLAPGEVNIGYNVFAPFRGKGYATRAVLLLMERLRAEGVHSTAVLKIAPENEASVAVAMRTGFSLIAETAAELRFVLALRPMAQGG